MGLLVNPSHSYNAGTIWLQLTIIPLGSKVGNVGEPHWKSSGQHATEYGGRWIEFLFRQWAFWKECVNDTFPCFLYNKYCYKLTGSMILHTKAHPVIGAMLSWFVHHPHWLIQEFLNSICRSLLVWDINMSRIFVCHGWAPWEMKGNLLILLLNMPLMTPGSS